MPNSQSFRLGYADGWVLAHQSKDWAEIENILSRDTTTLKQYFDRWYLKRITTKSVSSVFHLNNHQSTKSLNISVDGKNPPGISNSKIFGVALDRQLTYRQQLEGSSNKIVKRNYLIRKLVGTSWGASTTVLRTSTLSPSYSVADYCRELFVQIYT